VKIRQSLGDWGEMTPGLSPATIAIAEENKRLKAQLRDMEDEIARRVDSQQATFIRAREFDIDALRSGSFVSLVNYVRDALCEILFEIFVRTADRAAKNQMYSFNILNRLFFLATHTCYSN
jgi:hypothetical protein